MRGSRRLLHQPRCGARLAAACTGSNSGSSPRRRFHKQNNLRRSALPHRQALGILHRLGVQGLHTVPMMYAGTDNGSNLVSSQAILRVYASQKAGQASPWTGASLNVNLNLGSQSLHFLWSHLQPEGRQQRCQPAMPRPVSHRLKQQWPSSPSSWGRTFSKPLLTLNIACVTLTANLQRQAAFKLELWQLALSLPLHRQWPSAHRLRVSQAQLCRAQLPHT